MIKYIPIDQIVHTISITHKFNKEKLTDLNKSLHEIKNSIPIDNIGGPILLRSYSFIFEIGKKHPGTIINGKSIYSMEYGKWDKAAADANNKQGEFSIELAKDAMYPRER